MTKMTRAERRRQQRQQKKQQRRADQGHKHYAPPPVASDEVEGNDVQLAEDMRALFPNPDAIASPDAMAEVMSELAWDSVELAEEPEFEEVTLSPIAAVGNFLRLVEELDYDPETFFSPSSEEEEENSALLDRTLEALLTPEVIEQLLDALTQLRTRLRQSRQKQKLARAAIVQMMVNERAQEAIIGIGMVRTLMLKRLSLGFDLLRTRLEVEEGIDWDDSLSLQTLRERVRESGLAEEMEQHLADNPTLAKTLTQEVDEMYSKGEHALFSGNLKLNFYSDAECEAALAIIAEITGLDEEETLDFETLRDNLPAIVTKLTDYLETLVSDERYEQMRTQLDAFVNDPAYDPMGHGPFIMVLQNDFAEYPLHENFRELLLALMGEAFAYGNQLTDEEAEAPTDKVPEPTP